MVCTVGAIHALSCQNQLFLLKKEKTMKSTLLKALAMTSVLAFGTAHADSIQVDLNGDTTLTAAFEELSVDYNSHTLIDLQTGAVHTYAGTALINNNILNLGEVYTSFDDMSALGGVNTFTSAPNTNVLRIEEGGTLFQKESYLTFGVDLIGTFDITTGITYTSGTLDLWQGYTNANIAPVKVMTSTFSAGGLTAGNQDVLSISGAADILKDGVMFFDQNGTPVGFKEYLAAKPLADIYLTIDQNVTGGAAALITAVQGGEGFMGQDGSTVYVSANHNASLTFDVPEPTSLAILGLGLLAFAGTRRKA